MNQDYVMLIMNCTKYYKKALFQKKTWLKKCPDYLRYYHVIGDPTLSAEFEFNEDDHVLTVKTEDDYVSLPKKVIAAYIAIYKTFDFKYIFKTDDDQILVKPSFFHILPTLLETKQSHYGGYVVDVKRPYLSKYNLIHPELPPYVPILQTKYCSGRFYFLSCAAVEHLILKKHLIEKECLEDYAIGYNLANNFKENIMPINTNDFFTDIELSDFPEMLATSKI
jgi:hypothetical protein